MAMHLVSDPDVNESTERLGPGRRIPNTQWRVHSWIAETGRGARYEVRHEVLGHSASLHVMQAAPTAIESFLRVSPVSCPHVLVPIEAIRIGPDTLAVIVPIEVQRDDGPPRDVGLRGAILLGRQLAQALQALHGAGLGARVDQGAVHIDPRRPGGALEPAPAESGQRWRADQADALRRFLLGLAELADRKELRAEVTSAQALELALIRVQAKARLDLGPGLRTPASTPPRLARKLHARSRRLMWPLVAALGLGGMAAAVLASRAAVDANEPAVARLARAAHDAAARARYVYPPPNEPEARTAFRTVLEIERLGGVSAPAARQLRDEFAETLVYLGDKYWATEGGRIFAIDYYAQALLFVPEDPRARERGLLTPGQLARLETRATDASFTKSELEAVEPLAVLADLDEVDRDAKIEALLRERSLIPAQTRAALQTLVAQPRHNREPVVGGAASPAPSHPPAAPRSQLEVEAAEPPSPPDRATAHDPRGSRRYARIATTAQADGHWDAARAAWLQALDADPTCAKCLMGLSDIAFEQARHRDAVRYARRAVDLAPRNAGYRINLGDAYRKRLRFRQARQHYERAKELGHPDAQSCLDALADEAGAH